MAKYTGFENWRNSLLAAVQKLRADKTAAESAMSDWKSRAEEYGNRIIALQERLSMPVWAELDSGATVAVGTKVRYMLKVYECTTEHTKALTRLPSNGSCWREVAD
ncbi:MAG: hypothetical protein RR482_02365 [Clostridia bacterium]